MARKVFGQSGLLTVLLTATLAVTACAPAEAPVPDKASELLQRRLVLLEEENARLRAVVVEFENQRREVSDFETRQQIEEVVARLRGLPFLGPVQYRSMAKEDLPALLESKIAEQYSDEQLAELGEIYALLGLIPAGLDIKQAYLDLFSEQVAAFFDQDTGELVMFEGKSLESAPNRVVLAHELTHALQDQHFNLSGLPLQIQDNDDVRMAVTSVLEGDATVLMGIYLLDDLGPGSLHQMVMNMLGEDMEQLMAAPRFLRESLLFPYMKGQTFVAALIARGGFAEVDLAYDRLPASTLEILDPSIYWNGGLRPVTTFEWSAENEEHAFVTENTLGAFAIQFLAEEWLEADAPERPWDGWLGDRYRVYVSDAGLILESRSKWKNADSARKFARLMESIWQVRAEDGRNFDVRVENGNEVVFVSRPAES